MFARTTRGFSLAGAMAYTICELRIDIRDSNEPFLGAANVISRPVKSQVQISHRKHQN